MKKSSKVSKVLGSFVGIILIVILVTSALIFFQSSDSKFSSWFFSNVFGVKEIVGSGKIISKSENITNFDAIKVGGYVDVTVTPGTQGHVVLSADERVLPYIDISKLNNQLSIGVRSNVFISESKPEKAVITTPILHSIILGGVATLHAMNINSDSLTLKMGGKNNGYVQGDIKKMQIYLGGNSNLHVNLTNADNIQLNMGGIGTVYLSGNTKNLTISTGGKATVIANNLIADDVTINGAGISNITVHALKNLSISTSGKSEIKYVGNPTIKKQSFGPVTIEKINDDVK